MLQSKIYWKRLTNIVQLVSWIMLPLIIAACSGLAGEPEIVATVGAPQADATSQYLSVNDPDALGEYIFQRNCASCHGATGRGDGEVAVSNDIEVPDFTDPTTVNEVPYADWVTTIRYGRLESMMPPWENALTEEEIQAVAEYTYTLHERAIPIVEAEETTTPETTVEPELEEAIGTVYGTIINGTSGGDIPEQVSVALHVLDAEMAEIAFETQVVNSDGAYEFENVPVRLDYFYLITAIYNEAVFYSEQIVGTPSNPTLHLPVTVYEITNDPSVVEIEMLVTRIITDADELIFQQLINFRNTSDRIYRTERQFDPFAYESVHIVLPEDVTVLNGSELAPRFLLAEDGRTMVDTQPVLPGNDHLVEVVYAKPYSLIEDTLSIEFPVEYDMVQPVEFLVQPAGFHLESSQFEGRGVQQYSTGLYESYLGDALQAGDTLSYSVLPGSTFHPPTTTSSTKPIALAMAAAGLGFFTLAGVIYFRGMRTKSLDKGTILEEIAQLEQQYNAGEIPEADYEQQRASLKKQLTNLMERDEQ